MAVKKKINDGVTEDPYCTHNDTRGIGPRKDGRHQCIGCYKIIYDTHGGAEIKDISANLLRDLDQMVVINKMADSSFLSRQTVESLKKDSGTLTKRLHENLDRVAKLVINTLDTSY